MDQLDITKLDAAARLRLIEELWDSLADDEAPLPPAQREELLRRATTLDADEAHAVTWEALRAELRAHKG